MRLILIGCEYVGTTTLANAITQWALENMGARFEDFHSHWKFPHISTEPVSEEDQQLLLQLSPGMKELILRTNLEYHLHPLFYRMPDHNMVGHYIEESIYAPLYFGYGGPNQTGDRRQTSRSMERTIMEFGPGTTLVHLKATPDVIRSRMRENPHHNAVLQEKDVEYVLQRFQEEYGNAVYFNRMELDTSSATVEESLAEWVEKMDLTGPSTTGCDCSRTGRGRPDKDVSWAGASQALKLSALTTVVRYWPGRIAAFS